MSGLCKICVVKLNRDELTVKCQICSKLFHSKCVLPQKEIECSKKLNYVWTCTECFVKPKANKSAPATSNVDKISTPDQNVSYQHTSVQTPSNCDVDFSDSITSFKFIYDQLKKNELTFTKRFDGIDILLTKIEGLQLENHNLKKKVADLEWRIDSFEQSTRANTLEIFGLPDAITADKTKLSELTVKLINTGLNLHIDTSAVQSIFKVNSQRMKKVIIKFRDHQVRDSILVAKRKQRVTTDCIGLLPSVEIFINENLTKSRSHLYAEARKRKKMSHFKYLWIRNGNILVRKTEGCEAKLIKSVSDLDEI